MKDIIFIGFFLSTCFVGFSQSYVAKFSNSSGTKKVKFIAGGGSIKVVTHANPEVAISTDDYQAPPERAKGLKPLYNNAVDNTGIGLEVTEQNNLITIRKAIHKDMTFVLKVPEDSDFAVKETDWNSRGIQIKDVKGEIEIDAKGSKIWINNVPGPVVASTVNGDIEVVFSNVNPDQPSSISCTNGYIDVSLPGTTNADLQMKSINGEIYTDFKINMPDRKGGLRRLAGGDRIIGTINGGGVEISLHAINSDIYLRKAK